MIDWTDAFRMRVKLWNKDLSQLWSRWLFSFDMLKYHLAWFDQWTSRDNIYLGYKNWSPLKDWWQKLYRTLLKIKLNLRTGYGPTYSYHTRNYRSHWKYKRDMKRLNLWWMPRLLSGKQKRCKMEKKYAEKPRKWCCPPTTYSQCNSFKTGPIVILFDINHIRLSTTIAGNPLIFEKYLFKNKMFLKKISLQNNPSRWKPDEVKPL